MQIVARILQLVGLSVPPVAIIAELNRTISLGQMLGFLLVSVCCFAVGYLLQRYSGANK